MFQAYPDAQGASRPLDRNSQGMLSGQGAGMFVLKRYRNALRDGDPIYATIAGIGLSNDGRGKHVLSPQARGQVLALERAYRAADLSPASVPYIECHATGTPIGDRTELDALHTFFGAAGAAPYLGAAKSNCGHLLTAAGMVGMTKTILGLAAGVIPATLHVTEPLDSPDGPATSRVVRQATPWPETDSVRRGGVNGFGFGGTNAHIILERGPLAEPAGPPPAPLVPGPLAIIGMAAHFGPCADLAAFEQAIYTGTPQFGPLPPTRWRGLEEAARAVYDLTPPPGAYIESFAFDFLHFRSPPGGGDQPIPQQLLVLQVADQALRDSGLAAGGNVAVLVAMGTELALHPFLGRVDAVGQIRAGLAAAGITLTAEELAELEDLARAGLHEPSPINQSTSFIGNIMASRIAAQWDFTGPAFTVSAEENSAFRALELAQFLLTTGEVEAVVVGAVDLAGGVEEVLARRQFGPLASTAPTLSFDEQMQGVLVGEGAGAVVLRRYDPSQAEPERIYAVLDVIAGVQPAGVPIAAPGATWDVPAVAETMGRAWAAVGSPAATPDYLEVCGSGIAGQDSAEVAGLLAAYGPAPAPTCALGSVKALVGHTGAAAGMASLIKTALCLYHRYIPATTGWHGPKAPAQWQGSPFYVPDESRPWFTAAGQPRRAGVNGLSADGSYIHLVLSDAPAVTLRPSRLAEGGCWLLPLAGRDTPALQAALDTLEQALTAGTDLRTLAATYLAAVAQAPGEAQVLALVAHTPAELVQEIAQARTGLATAATREVPWQTPRGSYFTARPLGPAAPVAFVYPGGFTAYPGMGRDLFRHFPALHERMGQLVGDVGAAFLETEIYPRRLVPAAPGGDLPAPVAMLESGMALSAALTMVLRDDFGVQPQAALGYSMGESAMLWALGVWTNTVAGHAALHDHPLFHTRLTGPQEAVRAAWGLPPATGADDPPIWASYVLAAPATTVQAHLAGVPRVYLTHINSPKEVVISGDPAACRAVIGRLRCAHLPAPVSIAIHAPVTRSEYPAIVQMHHWAAHAAPGIRFYSGVQGVPIRLDPDAIAAEIAESLCSPVDFPHLVNSVYADGVRIFCELGPARTCTRWISATLQGQPHLALATNQPGTDDATAVVRTLAALVSHRVPLDLTCLAPAATPAAQPRRPAVAQTVLLGGPRLRDIVLAEPALARFAHRRDFARMTHDSAPPPALAPPPPPQPQLAAPTPPPQPQAAGPATQAHLVFLAAQREAVQHLATLLQQQIAAAATPTSPAPPMPSPPVRSDVIWDEADMLEFAEGSIARVFGDEYAVIDTYPRRVRLPMPPYLLVSRVTRLAATRGRYEPSAITTEFDIPPGGPYTVDGQALWAVTVESGQCDLLLISYLGIDFENKGERVYRLLDCALTFLGDLPRAGDTLRYDIRINSFARSGENLLFFFSYECYVGDTMILRLDRGCAGFFSDQELAEGKGIIVTADEEEARRRIVKQWFDPPHLCRKTAFTRDDLLALTEGRLDCCFGPTHQPARPNPALRLPAPPMLMLDRITTVDAHGGAWGLGRVVAEQDLAPDTWFFPCHFRDDPVMAGSLMAEGCVQLMQFYLLYLGLHLQMDDARFQPVRNLQQKVRCRGQVTPGVADKLIYEVEITGIALDPTPQAHANITVIFNGKTIVSFENLGLQLAEKSGGLRAGAHHAPALAAGGR
jgi:PfaB family protein